MAKSVSPDEAVFVGLRKAVGALPATLPLSGTGGIFPGGVKGKELADLAIAQGFLSAKEERIKSSKSAKKVVYGLLTDKGIKRVVEVDSPKAVLEALLPAVQAVGKRPDSLNLQTVHDALTRAAETCVNVIKEGFAKLEGEVLKALAPSAANAVDPGVVLNALQQALNRVEAPVSSTASPAPSTSDSTSTSTAMSDSALANAIVAFVDSWARAKTVGCQFDDLWNHLKERDHQLSIGTFHDALRKLHEANRIRLGGWARMIDDIPRPQLVLFISHKVMYYAQPVYPNG